MEHILRMLKALSDANRLNIINLLKEQSLCACDIQTVCQCGQATLSHHMKILVEANLVIATKEGKWVYYQLNKDSFQELQNFLAIEPNQGTTCLCDK